MSDAKQEKPGADSISSAPMYTIAFMLIVFFEVSHGSSHRVSSTVRPFRRPRASEVAVAGTYQEVDKVYTDSETGKVDLRRGVDAVLQAPAKGIRLGHVVAFVC
ncbi:MAG: hypothetical protein ACLU0O_08705 [Collinsella sp.]